MFLQMTGISKSFPGVRALNKVDFGLAAGEIHVLLGENGAGKSTLVKVMSGAIIPDSGALAMQGKPISLLTPADAQRAGIAVIYQEFSLVPHLSVAENIALGIEPGWLGLISNREVRRQARAALERFEMQLSPDRSVASLSVAERQMVEIARALSRDSRILIMDEPTSALAAREIETLFQLIRRLQTARVGIVFITHRMEEIFEIGDRVTILRDGENVGCRDIAGTEVTELIRLMVDRDIEAHYPARSSHPGEEVLRVQGLTTDTGLTRISFGLRRGEVLGIGGLMGSGRTELARAIFGADRKASGEIQVAGRSLPQKAEPSEAIRAGLALLSEDRQGEGLVLCLSVSHNLSLPSLKRVSRLGVILRQREEELSSQAFSQLRIRALNPEQRVIGLSGGNQQKVALGKWLLCKSAVLMLDEPTRGIDVGTKAEIYRIINRLVESGLGVLLISSDLPELIGLSDRVLVLREGHNAGEFEATSLTPEKLLSICVGDRSDAA